MYSISLKFFYFYIMEKTKLIKFAVYTDGGTTIWIDKDKASTIKTLVEVQEFLNDECFYIDNRINSTTKGELFNKYPSKEDAVILDKSLFEFEEVCKVAPY